MTDEQRRITARVEEYSVSEPAYLQELELRRRILREPLGLDLTVDDRADDARSIHLGVFEEGAMLGCLLLTPRSAFQVQMRQVAVVEGRRGEGLGRMLVEASESRARERGFVALTAHARDTAVEFYRKLGYSVVGEPFVEVTVPHRTVRKEL